MKTTFKVEGLAELDRQLGELSASAGKGVLRRVGRKGLQPFDQTWRAKAPKDTGDLAESGGVGSKLTRSVRKAVERENTVEVFAGPGGNPQAWQQEVGNHQHAAQPFVRPAWDETKDEALQIVRTELWTEISKAAKRKARKEAKAAAAAASEG